MRVGLVGPTAFGCEFNPGWHMITDGIRYLVRQAVPDTQFISIDMIKDNIEHWHAAATCDALIMCGNPRFSMSAEAWWECGIWQRLIQLHIAGVKVIDGWAGAAVGLLPERNAEQMATQLFEFPRSQRYLALARILAGRIITRDLVMQKLYERASVPSILLPCSSWWAAKWHHIEAAERSTNAILLLNMPGHDWLPETIRQLRSREQPCLLVASTWNDYLWARGVGLNDVILMADAESLLQFFARCNRVLAFRIHAAIPAASLGCEVGVVSIDSRAMTCDPFDLPHVPFYDLLTNQPKFAKAKAPDEQATVAALREMLK